MDLEEESSKSRSERVGEEGKSETLEKMDSLGENKVGANGELGPEELCEINTSVETGDADGIGEGRGSVSPAEAVDSPTAEAKANEDGFERESIGESPTRSVGSPPGAAPEAEASKPSPKKGYGLKKWRRIRRDLSKEGSGSADSAQILKRRLSLAEPQKLRSEYKQKSDGEGDGEGSVASVESRFIGGSPLTIAAGALDPELGLLVASTGFSIGVDSDNSEDRSSKSSTAASAPRLRHEAIGFGRERSRGKNLGGRGSGHVVQQRSQRGKGGGIDVSKKFRGDRLRIEKENSQSSIESDLRSSNTAFGQLGSVIINGKHSEKSFNYSGEHTDEAQRSEEVRSAYNKENGGAEKLLREDVNEDMSAEIGDKSENIRSRSDLDPFVESVALLQAAQEALENEIQSFAEIGKECTADEYDGHEETEGSSSPTFESDLIELNQKKEHLEYKLEEAYAAIKAKDSKVLELEAILNRTKVPVEERESTLESLQEKCKARELELESMLEKKIEAEIEYLVMARTTESWRILSEDHAALFEEQKLLAGDQTQVMLRLREAESKAVRLKARAEELEAKREALSGTEGVLKLQNKVYKMSLCCFTQSVMLCIAIWLFLMHLLPPPTEVVPT